MKKHYLIIALFAMCSICNAQNFTNPSLEIWGSGPNCAVNAIPTFWTNYSNECVAVDEANFSKCPSTIPPNASNGIIYARACASINGAEGVFQNVSGFTIGSTYQITYDYAASNLYGGTDDLQWHLFIDDVNVNQTPVFYATDSIWATNTFIFTATAATHKIGVRAFTASNVTGVGSAGIDNFSLSNITSFENIVTNTTVTIFPNPFNDFFTVEVNNNFDSEIIIYDISSRKIKQQKFTKTLTVDAHQFPPGIYFYDLTSKGTVYSKGKIVKD